MFSFYNKHRNVFNLQYAQKCMQLTVSANIMQMVQMGVEGKQPGVGCLECQMCFWGQLLCQLLNVKLSTVFLCQMLLAPTVLGSLIYKFDKVKQVIA